MTFQPPRDREITSRLCATDVDRPALLWAAAGSALLAFVCILAFVSPRFGYAYDVAEMPVLELVMVLVLAGLAFSVIVPRLIHGSLATDRRCQARTLAIIVAVGLAARLVLLGSEPVLEDDYQRYLWDGAVVAHGISPYAVSPLEASQRDDGSALAHLAIASGAVIGRVNHAELRTIYPPVAQAAFALAHVIQPWSLVAWRALVLILDLTSLALILLLLRACSRSPLWAALYWWNPVVLKELFNSAHMEAVVLPLVLLALWLAIRQQPVGAAATLAIAAGAKIWPILLLPLIVRPLLSRPTRLVAALLLCGALLAVGAAPIVVGGFDENSGFRAYVETWQRNSALTPLLESAVAMVLDFSGFVQQPAALLARGFIAVCLGALAIVISVRTVESADDLIGRAAVLIAALVLLSPAQYPWYSVWFAPFLAFRPWTGFLVLAVTVPLYYSFFYFAAHDQADVFQNIVVWLIWAPIWAALLNDVFRRRFSSAVRS